MWALNTEAIWLARGFGACTRACSFQFTTSSSLHISQVRRHHLEQRNGDLLQALWQVLLQQLSRTRWTCYELCLLRKAPQRQATFLYSYCLLIYILTPVHAD